ncbi:hypothetical protein CPB86DRAFT_289409 [Serendipita vermifera]|nr:hypothetical protein CPB86DRAFT_289409 [Serendipita vermifera]
MLINVLIRGYLMIIGSYMLVFIGIGFAIPTRGLILGHPTLRFRKRGHAKPLHSVDTRI